MGGSSSKAASLKIAPSPKAEALGPYVVTFVQEAKVDVVFLHGLTGHREKTWTAEGETKPWLKTLLPKDLPTARIITYGYDADVLHLTRVAGQNTIREHAKTLINDLSALRTDTVGRPIIFVVHSLGGLVIQEALQICTNPNDEGQGDLLSSTRGVAFFGTPHAGSDLEKFATAVINIVRIAKKPNKRLLGVLRRNSEILANIKDGFLTMVLRRLQDRQSSLRPIELHAFIEEQPVDFLKRRVVEPDSAKIPGYNFDTIPANHMNMTKFSAASDLGYQRLLNRLKRWIGDEIVDDDSISVQYTLRLSSILRVRCPTLDSSDFLQQIELSDIEESLEWFVKSSEYRVWKQADASKLLIHGQRGDGKTVVMSYVLKSLNLEHQFGRQRDVASIFCSSENSELEMVSSLACQLLQKNNIRTAIARQIAPIPKFDQGVHLSDLWNLLKSVIETTERETIILIDGQEVDGREIPMRVLISSETRGDIMKEFGHYSTIDREKERRECLQTLAFEEWNARETRVEDVAVGGEWMASHEEYTQWIESSTPSALWLEGKPGSGKSTLAKLIVHKLENRENDPSSVNDARHVQTKSPQTGRRTWTFNNPEDKNTIIARFYYSFRGGNTETSHVLMLRSIVYQIWNSNSRLYELLKERYRELRKNNIELFWSYENLKLVLQSLHEIDFPLTVVIVVDGMDESDNDRRDDILRFLPNLVDPNSNCIVKILIASRPENDISHRLKKACSHHIRLQDVNEKDISLVVDNWIEQMESRRGCKRSIFKDIRDYVIKESSGVFLWVTLVLRDMEKCLAKGGYSEGDLDERVHRLPKELGGEHGFYKQMLFSLSADNEDDMRQEERARRIFYWVTFPKRPISVAELEEVLATPLSQEKDLSKYDFAYNRPHELDLGIVSACGGLVEVRDSNSIRIVQLIHQTAREFLLQEAAKPYHLIPALGDMEIASTCCQLIRIVFTGATLQTEVDDDCSHSQELAEYLSSHSLLVYALTNFTKHLAHLEEDDKNVYLQFENFVAGLSDRRNSYACLLLSQWVETKFPKMSHIDVSEMVVRSCAHATLAQAKGTRTSHLTDILIALRPNLLFSEVEAGYKDTASLLLRHGCDPNARDNNGQTPLSPAAKHGDLDIVQLLLDKGSNPDTRDNNGQTPLSLAAIHWHLDIVRLLLNKGSNPDTRDNNGQTPLSLATIHGHLDIARLLLIEGCDRDAKDNNGQTPLSMAIIHGHQDIVQMLLLRACDFNAKDNNGQTPLSLAAKHGHQDIVQLLLDKGSNLDTRDNDGQTPFSLAAIHGHQAVAKLLELR
ncbi:hypothetical protein MKX08_002512 [Trichoderma sp. CBMAI-0020]|nr:hypothetical protein MKX08_002512 [Trichoderma sp. CBMAI-0020]